MPRRGIYDNMKTAVDKLNKGKGHTDNARFAVMCAHYLFDPDFCNVASGWEKGFYSTVDLVNLLEREKYDGKTGRIAQGLLRTELAILDELGYLPFSQRGDHHQPQLLGMVECVW